MGKPAARLADTTAHGGTIAGPGAPNVLIGKMPAATLGDMQICPMCTGPVPHVGGLISLGSTGVFIGKKPAARVSDVCICVGPPSMPVVGHFQTLIGEVGGAGGGAQAAMAATAQSAVTSPGSVTPMEVPEPTGTTTENHEIKIEIVDSAGLPLMVPYEIKDPNGAMLRGVSTVRGKVWHGGYAQAGGYELRLKALTQCRINATKIKPGDKVEIEVLAEGFTAQEVISFAVLWKTSQGEQLHGVLNAKVQGNKAKAAYVLPLECGDLAETSLAQSGYQVYEMWVMARSGQWLTLSRPSKIETKAMGELWCGKNAVSGAKAKITLADNTAKECRTDSNGKFVFENMPAGCFDLEIFLQDESLFKGHLLSGTTDPVRIKLHRSLTIKDVADKLIEIEGRDGFAAARDAVAWLDYRKISSLSKIGHAKNDPNLMPSRFMILQGATDSSLKSKGHLDAWPLKLHDAAPHVVSIENLVKALVHLECLSEAEAKKSRSDLVDQVYQSLLKYLDGPGKPSQEPNLKAWKHTVAAGDRLSEIANRFGEPSWETVLAKNASSLKTDPDRLPSGTTLNMPEREHPWLKWFEDQGYDLAYLGGSGYLYPWQYTSLTLAETDGQDLPEKEYPMDVTVVTQSKISNSTEPRISALTLKKATDLFFMAPRSLPIEIRTSKAVFVYTPPSNGTPKAKTTEAESTSQEGLNPQSFQSHQVTLV